MAMEWELIQTRTVSGKGVLKLPEDKKKIRAYILYSNVVRFPVNKYVNKNWNPSRSRYAQLSFLYQGYVIDTHSVEFDGQAYSGINDISGQTLIAVKCAYAGMLESISKLSAIIIAADPVLLAAGTQVVSITDLIKDYENLRLSWDEIRIQCYADTALQFKLYSLKYGTCDPEKDKDKPPPPPPPPPPKTPPGQPLTVSDPYTSNNDDTNTEPYPLDKPESALPKGGDCERMKVTAFLKCIYEPNSHNSEQIVFGPVYGVRVNFTSDNPNATHQYQIDCRGGENASGTSHACIERGWYTFESIGSLSEAQLISVVKA